MVKTRNGKGKSRFLGIRLGMTVSLDALNCNGQSYASARYNQIVVADIKDNMRIVKWLLAPVLLGIYLAIALFTVDHGSDQAKIEAVIARGEAAAQERDLAELVSCVSRRYSDQTGLNYERLRILIANAMRSEGPYRVAVSEQKIKIEDDRAIVNLRVTISRPDGAAFYDHKLTLIFAKEPARHMLIIKTDAWRVISSENLALSTGELML